VRARRRPSVGNWLLETDEFQEWRGGDRPTDKAIYFCSGAGSGEDISKVSGETLRVKRMSLMISYTSSLVIDSLDEQASRGGGAVVILYCDHHEQHDQTTSNIIGAILKQLVVKDDRILGSVREAFLKTKNVCGGPELCLSDLVRMLKKSIVHLYRVFICVDALDELRSKELPELLVSLRGIVQELPNVRVFLTGRPYVEAQITRHLTRAVTIPISPKPHDIESYLKKKLEMDTEPYAMDDGLRSNIINTIHGKLSKSFVGISILHYACVTVHLLTITRRFLLVSLIIDAILEEVTVSDRRKRLNQMSKGNGLGDVYTKTLERMKAQKGRKPTFGINALMWVEYSERPLQAPELCHALGVEIGSQYLDPGSIPSIETLLWCSIGLITLEKASNTVRLVHFTLRGHLSNTPTLFERPRSTIAEICLTYLNSKSVRELPSSSVSAIRTFPLLNYASCHWEKHARGEMTQNVEELALRLLDGFGQHISSRILLIYGDCPMKLWTSSPDLEQDWFRGFTCIHWTASLGMLEMTSALLEMKEWDLNVDDATGNTAIAWAARGGHTDILKELLEQKDADPNIADKDGRTSLSWAAWQGEKGVVNILLERKDINLGPVHRDGRTPLLWAVSMGNEEAVKLILERRNADCSSVASGRTPATPPTKPGAPAFNTPLVTQILIDRSFPFHFVF